MKLGVAMFATDEGIRPGELGRLAEERGFESLFFPEHTHIPASRESPAPGGGELPREYFRTFDPFVALTEAASATERLLVGTGVCLIVERDPIATAKAVASLDVLSGGRLLLGVGAGWNLEEMRNHGTDPSRRFGLMKHRVRAMKALWTQDEASYESPYVAFERVSTWPKPLQQPHPPVLIAGNGPRAIDRVLAYGDEWLPEPEPRLTERIAELRRRAHEAGRDQIKVTVYGASTGDVPAYGEAGAHRCVFWLPPRDRGETERRVIELAEELDLAS